MKQSTATYASGNIAVLKFAHVSSNTACYYEKSFQELGYTAHIIDFAIIYRVYHSLPNPAFL
jgi:hypothetical protein